MRLSKANRQAAQWTGFLLTRDRLMSRRVSRWRVWAALMGPVATLPVTATTAFTGPVELRVDNLKTPLGIDDPAPRLSWQLQDPARGAKQTAYEVLVASRAELLQTGQTDVWDSGRIESGKSLNVRYGGPAVIAGARYF